MIASISYSPPSSSDHQAKNFLWSVPGWSIIPIRRKLLNLKQRVSLATFSSDHLAEQGIVQPIGWKHVFFFKGEVVFITNVCGRKQQHTEFGAKCQFQFLFN